MPDRGLSQKSFDHANLQGDRLRDPQAVIALEWLLLLAEAEDSFYVRLNDYHLSPQEVSNLITGRQSPDQIIAFLDLLKFDRKDYDRIITQQLRDRPDTATENAADPLLQGDPSAPAQTALGTFIENDVSTLITYDIAQMARRIEDENDQAHQDVWYLNEYDEINERPLDPLKIAAKRLTKVKTARQRYENGDFYIRTVDGLVLPAWEQMTVKLHDQVIVDYRTDNQPLSVDQLFYHANGQDFDPVASLAQRKITCGRFDVVLNPADPVRFEDVTDEAMIDALNAYTSEITSSYPYLAYTLVTAASRVVKGLQAPTTETDIKAVVSNYCLNKRDLHNDVPLSEQRRNHERELQNFIAASKAEIAQNNQVAAGSVKPPQAGLES